MATRTTHENIDIATNNVVNQVELFKNNSARLQIEAFKIDSIIGIFNNCADRCNLSFKESGLKGRGEGFEDVECFQNCVTKSHKISAGMFQ